MTRLLRAVVDAERPAFAVLQSVFAQFGVLAINVATGVLTARLLGAEGRGVFSAITTWPQLMAQLAVSGIGAAIIFRLRDSRSNVGGVSAAALLIVLMTSTAAVLLGLAVLPLAMRQYSAGALLLAQLALLVTYQSAVLMAFKQVFAGVGAYKLFNLSNLLPQLFYFVAVLACAGTVGLNVGSATASLVGGGVVATLLVLPGFLRHARPRWAEVKREINQLRSFCLRAAGTDLVGAVSTYVDRLVLIPLIAPAELGFYVVAFSFSRLVLIVQPAVTAVMFSSLSGRPPEQVKLLHDHAFRFALLALGGILAVLPLVDRQVLSLFYGEEFGSAAFIFRILLAEAALTCLAQLVSQLYFALNRPGIISAVQFGSLAVSLASIAVLVPQLGAVGASWALLIAAAVRLVALLAGLRWLGLDLPRPYLRLSDLAFLRSRLT